MVGLTSQARSPAPVVLVMVVLCFYNYIISQYLSGRFSIRHPAPRNQPLLNQPLLNQPSTFRNELCMLVANVLLFAHQDTNCTENW